MLQDIQFRNLTIEEAIQQIRKCFDSPNSQRLIGWLAKAAAFDDMVYRTRVALADGERYADKIAKGK